MNDAYYSEINDLWDQIHQYNRKLQELEEKIEELRNDVKNNYIDSGDLEQRLGEFEV